MNVLFLTPRLPHQWAFSGDQMIYQRMLRLMGRGYRVGLLSFCSEHEKRHLNDLPNGLAHAKIMDTPQISWLHAGNLEGVGNPARAFRQYGSSAMSRALGHLVEEGGYDVVIAEYTAMGMHLFRNRHLPAVRKIVSVHEAVSLDIRRIFDVATPLRLPAMRNWARHICWRRHELHILESADAVLALTPEDRFGLLSSSRGLAVHVIPPSVETNTFRPMLGEKREHAIVFTGRYRNEQNQHAINWFLAEVWPKVLERQPDLILNLVGTSSHQISRAEKNVVCLGDQDDIRGYLARGHAFINPVLTGSGLRVKVLEAMSMGVPVVSTSIGAEGVPLFHGENGLLADSPEQMARAIDLVVRDQVYAARMGQAARIMVEQQFNWEVSMGRLEEVLHSVTARQFLRQPMSRQRS